MKKLIMTKGLPGSGKSTWAKEQIEKHPGQYKRVNKDDLRLMLDNSRWSKANEKFVILMRDTIALSALKEGWNVIIDDTNLHPKHELHLKELAKAGEAEFLIEDFTGVSLDQCIKQDLTRYNSVGQKVIMDMHNQFLRPKLLFQAHNPNIPNVIICDIDGTLALSDDNPYDRDFIKDIPNLAPRHILQQYRAGKESINHPAPIIIIFSGRNGKYKEVTKTWLEKNNIPYDSLYMREENDIRKDSIVKQEMYENHIKGKYNVLFVLDDRNQVVDLWRSLGLTCLQVAEGNF